MNSTVTSSLPAVEVCHFGTQHYPGSTGILTKKAAYKDRLQTHKGVVQTRCAVLTLI